MESRLLGGGQNLSHAVLHLQTLRYAKQLYLGSKLGVESKRRQVVVL